LTKAKDQRVSSIQKGIEAQSKSLDLVPTVEAIHDIHQVNSTE
jgi:hypothetical protein